MNPHSSVSLTFSSYGAPSIPAPKAELYTEHYVGHLSRKKLEKNSRKAIVFVPLARWTNNISDGNMRAQLSLHTPSTSTGSREVVLTEKIGIINRGPTDNHTEHSEQYTPRPLMLWVRPA